MRYRAGEKSTTRPPNPRNQARRQALLGTSQRKSRFTSREEYGDNWEELSLETKRRDGFRCMYHKLRGGKPCGKYFPPPFHGQLHAHHVIPRGKKGPNTLANLITLCHGCHGKIHRHMNQH